MPFCASSVLPICMFSRPWNLRSGRSIEKHWKQAPVKSFLSSILAQSCLIVERGGMNEARRNSDPAMPRPSTIVSKKIYFLVSLPGPWMAWVNWQWIAFTLSSVVRWWSWEKKTCFFPFCYGWVCSELRRKSGCWLHISQPPRLHVFISSFTNKRSHKIVKVDSISFFLLRKLNQVFSPVIYSGCPLFLESNFFEWTRTSISDIVSGVGYKHTQLPCFVWMSWCTVKSDPGVFMFESTLLQRTAFILRKTTTHKQHYDEDSCFACTPTACSVRRNRKKQAGAAVDLEST